MSQPLPQHQTLGRYQLQSELGRGMMGVVYRAIDPALGRPIALKTVSLGFSVPEEQRENFEKRFLSEARMAAGLSHPGIVVVHDVGRDPDTDTLFIALEFLQGETLDKAMGGKPMEWRDAFRLTIRLADALHHAHANGIVHRDIKPANIMILPSGEPKIMDFGIARVETSTLTNAGEFFGTPAYMSPEQASGEKVDGRSDIFSLGSVLYLLVTGKRAFEAPNVTGVLIRVARDDPQPPSTVLPLPPEVDAVVMKALAKKREQRYADGRSFAEDMEKALAGLPLRHAGSTLPSGGRRPPKPPPVPLPDTDDLSVLKPWPPDSTGRSEKTAREAPASNRGLLLALGAFGAIGLVVAVAIAAGLFLPRGDKPPIVSVSLPVTLPPITMPSLSTPPTTAPARTQPPPTTTPIVGQPGRLELDVEHDLRFGTLKLFVDEVKILDQPLEGRVTRKLLAVKVRRGRMSKVLEVGPGERVVRVQIEGDYNGSYRIRGTFASGVTKRLVVKVGGLVKKDLEVEWGS